MTEFELGFIIGLIEGEGSITLGKGVCKNYQGFSLHPRFFITNTNLQILNEAKRIIGGVIYTEKLKNPKHKIKYKLAIDGVKLKNFLLEICPYLLSKKKRCGLLIKYIDIHKRKNGYALEEIEIFNLIKKENQTGISLGSS